MNALIEGHIGFAHAIAAEMVGRYPPNITRGDLERAAEFGLVQAAQSYDPSRSVSFATFAYYRIRGAIFDEVRKSWGASHLKVSSDKTVMEECAEACEQAAELAASAEIDEYARSGSKGRFLLSDGAEPECLPAAIESPASHVLRKEEAEIIRKAICQLPQRHQFVLQAYYFDDLPLVKIGEQLNLSKSWVSRIHSQALAKLRKILDMPVRSPSLRHFNEDALPVQATSCPNIR